MRRPTETEYAAAREVFLGDNRTIAQYLNERRGQPSFFADLLFFARRMAGEADTVLPVHAANMILHVQEQSRALPRVQDDVRRTFQHVMQILPFDKRGLRVYLPSELLRRLEEESDLYRLSDMALVGALNQYGQACFEATVQFKQDPTINSPNIRRFASILLYCANEVPPISRQMDVLSESFVDVSEKLEKAGYHDIVVTLAADIAANLPKALKLAKITTQSFSRNMDLIISQIQNSRDISGMELTRMFFENTRKESSLINSDFIKALGDAETKLQCAAETLLPDDLSARAHLMTAEELLRSLGGPV
jgi:hypothetical protein